MRTNDEIRRLNMLVAIGKVGSAAKLAELASTSPAYISQIKNRVADSKSGTPKAMGDELARRMELAIRVPTGWMDAEHVSEWVSAGLVDAPPADPEGVGAVSGAMPGSDSGAQAWKDRLSRARAHKGMNHTEFARAVRASNPTVLDWENSVAAGGAKEISGVQLLRVCEVLGIDPAWLLNGTGDGPDAGQSEDRVEFIDPIQALDAADPQLVHIPKVRLLVSAGVSGFGVEPEPYDGTTTTVRADWLRRRQFQPSQLIAIRVRGRSMEPTFHDGDTVIINQNDTAPADGVVFVLNYGGEAVIKRMARDAGDWWLTSDNPDQQNYPRRMCRGDDCIIIGRVVRSEREHY